MPDNVSRSTPLGRDPQLSASPQTDEKKLLIAISGLSRQLTQHTADMNERFTQKRTRWRLCSRRTVLERLTPSREDGCTKACVRRLHNSETNCRRYEPAQGLSTPHNEAVTSYLLGAITASLDLHYIDKDDIVSACKTYYETVRRSFRYTQPENSMRAEAAKNSARSRARRKRLQKSRQSVLADEEVELWMSATVDLMSDEEDGVVGGVSGWIVPPSFRRPDLSELCVKLQSRLEAMLKYRATHMGVCTTDLPRKERLAEERVLPPPVSSALPAAEGSALPTTEGSALPAAKKIDPPADEDEPKDAL
ncbi:uncharacterized protein C14orf93-like [Fundulus heteroclitus]|uniref:uncharacterized protein C14orf93-like n=1 Tax=Fundulus heteroclitus TaxID=8078 RepID=UPI00165A5CDD|nr:uncharacterized protein C14orf93-like [Fundulus heteroclitus]